MLHHSEYKISFVLDQTSMFSILGEKKGIKKRHQVKPLHVIWHNLTRFYCMHNIRFSPKNTIHIDDLSRNFAMNPQQGLKILPFKNAPGKFTSYVVSRHSDKELLYITKYLLQLALVDDFETVSHKDWVSLCLIAEKF
jgi:ubiquitin-like domain-containing CTD phosphatase 1